ncbi:hypothetical protein ACN3XK_74205 [Actinomadura welshii]
MGVYRTDNSTDDGAENVEKPPAKDTQWRPRPDRPGSPGQPSRLESHREAAAAREAMTGQRDERDDKQPQPAEQKPAQAEKETADRGTGKGSETRFDDQNDGRSVADAERQKEKGEPFTQADEGEGDADANVPTVEERAGSERPERVTEADTEDKPGDGSDTDAQPKPEGKPEKPSDEEVREKPESKSATHRARENGSAESQDASQAPEQASAEGQESATDAWREHADAMRAKWADLESEQAPDEPPEEDDQGDDLQREDTSEGTEDPSGDEPGSWRGDGGQYLNLEENYAVDRAYQRLNVQESEATDSLKAREAEMSDVKLVGLEYRVKGEERFKEKAAEKLAAELRKSPTEAAESISDGLRYTYQIPRDSYVQGYNQIANDLKKDGYEMVFCRNSWDGAEYKGVNTRWRTSNGQLLEVQFHTPESFEAKQLTHGAYERQRNPLTGGQERERLKAFQREVSAGIPVPRGVGDIANYRKEGY